GLETNPSANLANGPRVVDWIEWRHGAQRPSRARRRPPLRQAPPRPRDQGRDRTNPARVEDEGHPPPPPRHRPPAQQDGRARRPPRRGRVREEARDRDAGRALRLPGQRLQRRLRPPRERARLRPLLLRPLRGLLPG